MGSEQPEIAGEVVVPCAQVNDVTRCYQFDQTCSRCLRGGLAAAVRKERKELDDLNWARHGLTS
jgi:hypothetical protein